MSSVRRRQSDIPGTTAALMLSMSSSNSSDLPIACAARRNASARSPLRSSCSSSSAPAATARDSSMPTATPTAPITSPGASPVGSPSPLTQCTLPSGQAHGCSKVIGPPLRSAVSSPARVASRCSRLAQRREPIVQGLAVERELVELDWAAIAEPGTSECTTDRAHDHGQPGRQRRRGEAVAQGTLGQGNTEARAADQQDGSGAGQHRDEQGRQGEHRDGATEGVVDDRIADRQHDEENEPRKCRALRPTGSAQRRKKRAVGNGYARQSGPNKAPMPGSPTMRSRPFASRPNAFTNAPKNVPQMHPRVRYRTRCGERGPAPPDRGGPRRRWRGQHHRGASW